jgi:hypothetical protein
MYEKEYFLQVPLQMGSQEYRFPELQNSNVVYDTWCEILPDRLKRLNLDLNGFDFTTDLYGMKENTSVNSEYILTTTPCRSAIKTYGRELKPHELNVINSLEGSSISLAEKGNCKREKYFKKLEGCNKKENKRYFFQLRKYHHGSYRIFLLAGRILYHPKVYPVMRKFMKK